MDLGSWAVHFMLGIAFLELLDVLGQYQMLMLILFLGFIAEHLSRKESPLHNKHHNDGPLLRLSSCQCKKMIRDSTKG
jgi:hypothetical protein